MRVFHPVKCLRLKNELFSFLKKEYDLRGDFIDFNFCVGDDFVNVKIKDRDRELYYFLNLDLKPETIEIYEGEVCLITDGGTEYDYTVSRSAINFRRGLRLTNEIVNFILKF